MSDEYREQIAKLEAQVALLESQILMLSQQDSFNAAFAALAARVETLQKQNDAVNKFFDPPEEQSEGENLHTNGFIPDGNCEDTSSNCRKTIEFQPGSGTHQNELQLVNVDGLSESNGNIPYIDVNSSGNGELQWVKADADFKVMQRKSGGSLGFDFVRAHS